MKSLFSIATICETMKKYVLTAIAVTAISLPLATLAQQTAPVAAGQPTNCTAFNSQMCLRYCSEKRNNVYDCTSDCDRRLRTCLGREGGIGGFSATHSGHYLWGNKWVGPLTKE